LPGPKGLPVLGNLLDIDRSRLHVTLEGWARTYGDLYTFRVGRKRAVVVSEPTSVERALRGRPGLFRRVATAAPIFRELGMPGVFSAEGDEWRVQRQLVVEALAQRNFGAFFPVLHAKLERLLQRWRRLADAGAVVDVFAELKRFTTDTTTHLAFGHDLNSIERDDDAIRRHLDLIFPLIHRRLNSPVAYWRVLKLPADRRADRAVREVRVWLSRLIDDARARLAREPEAAPTNLLEAMILARDDSGQPFSDEFIVGNALQILVAGEETSASAVAWAVHELCDAPDSVASLRQELEVALGADAVPKDLAACSRLTQAAAIMREALRLRAVAPMLFVQNNVETSLGGLALPQGTWLILLTRLGGMNPERVEAPELFRPARWQGESLVGPQPTAQDMPFGSGPRLCPGRSLANLEMRALLAMLYKNFDVHRADTRESVKEHFAFTLEPSGLAVRLKRRDLH
jgi:cytochrome P450